MAISFVAEAHGSANYATSISVAKPTGVVNGDVMIAIVGGSPSTPTGWTLVGSADSGGNSLRIVRVFYKVAASEGSSYTFTISTSLACASIVAYRGVDTTTPIDTGPSILADSGTNFTTGSLTAGANQWAMAFATGYQFGSSTARTFTESPGTERADFAVINSAGSGENTDLTVSDSAGNVTPGTYSVTQTRSAAADVGVSGLLLLNQLGGGVVSTAAGSASATAVALGATGATGVAALPGSAQVAAASGNPKALVGQLAFPGRAAATAHVADLPRKIPAGYAVVVAAGVGPMLYLGTPESRTVHVPPDLPTRRTDRG